MLPRTVSVTLAGVLLLGTAAAGVLPLLTASPEPHDGEATTTDDPAHEHESASTWDEAQVEALRGREGDGRVPTLLDALSLKRIPVIRIQGDGSFTPANGVAGGRGTLEDPYVLDGLYADTLHISDTSAVFELRNSFIRGALLLDWTDLGGFVHHNHIGDLRVNRNVERVGMPTAAVIRDNEIGQIGQLRHFDGVLAGNVVGDPGKPALGQRVLLLDGYNGALLLDNVVYGYTEIKLHGHHHSGMRGASHNHALADAEDHGERHHSLLVQGNRFIDPLGKGVRIHDRDHAGDDRTATSETNPALVGNHTHWTTLDVRGNTFEGAGLHLDVFNAPDEYHAGVMRGTARIEGNRFTALTGTALRLNDVGLGDVVVRDNEASLGTVPTGKLAGIRALRFTAGTLTLEGNTLRGYYYGVTAREFDAATTWSVHGLDAAGAVYPVWYDESVENAPGEGQAPARHGHEEQEHRAGGAALGLPAVP